MADVVQFRRAFRVVIDTIEISTLDVSFRVEKSLAPTPNKAEVKVMNLTPDHRAQVTAKPSQPVLIEAGYEGATSVLFLGKLRSARTEWEGPTSITTLASGDGSEEAQAARISTSVKPKTPTDLTLKLLAQAIGVSEGNLADAVRAIKATALGQLFDDGTVLYGNAAELLTRVCRSVGLTWSIQDGKLQFLSLKAALAGEAIRLTPSTGLIGSPTVDNKGVLHAKMLMQPNVFPGRLVVLESRELSGQYRVEKTVHSGQSDAQDWYVEIEGRRW